LIDFAGEHMLRHDLENNMPVLREWRAEIRRDLKDEYVRYVKETGLAAYLATPGNLGASVAVRDLNEERSEIVTLSWWADMQAVKAFAGTEIGRARYFPQDDRFLLTRPEHVHHYEATLSGFK
jgi:heme-degrading monooxygenase HmoA